MDNFRQLHQDSFVNDPKWLLAVAFWCQYYVACERYDRKVCSIRKPDGTAIPSNSFEMQSINANARKQHKALMADMQTYNIDSDMIMSAKKVAGQYDFKKQESETRMIPDYVYTLSL